MNDTPIYEAAKMTIELWIGIIVAFLGSNALVAFITSVFNRRKISAEVEKLRVDSINASNETAFRIMRETLENTVAPLNRRVDELEVENAELKELLNGQEQTLNELNAKFNKLQLAFIINESYIRSLGHTPPIHLSNLYELSPDDLRDIAMSMKNIERRRGGGKDD